MIEVTNLALSEQKTYNYKSNIIKTNLKRFQQLDSREFQRKTTRLKVLRENILASGMELTDIDKANQLLK